MKTREEAKGLHGLRARAGGGRAFRVATVFLVGAMSGCTLIAGIENREDDGSNSEFDTVDKATDLPTTKVCVEYCDLVLKNCTEENSVYATRNTCLNTCNALPKGTPDEAIDNTIACRMDRARAAASSPDEECAAAGPNGGNGACGSSCDAFCVMLESECPDDFAGLPDCEKACSTIPLSGKFNLEGDYFGDTVECRLIHLGAVGAEKQASMHCGHGRYIALDKCVPPEEDQPSCARYCDVVMTNCSEFAVYESRDHCMAACGALPVGEFTDTTENTVGCRIYHSKNSAGVPVNHCPHGGPTGDGHCGVYTVGEDGFTGNCESYCYLFQAACGAEFDDAGYDDIEECAEECSTTFNNRGAKNDVGYLVDDATEDDTVQCRTYYAVKILAGDDVSCDLVVPDGDCE